ncbi:MAG: MarR family transcriptional regulator [Bacillaceae bacterium]|nr:MarR family transcriptional regulator [Bacillaceae bacterium]
MYINIEQLNEHWTDIYYCLHYKHKEKITHQAVRIMQHIKKNQDVTVGLIAKKLSVSHNTASEHIKRLIKKGYVKKIRKEKDERKVFLTLTSAGQDALHYHTALDAEKLAGILNNLSPSEQQRISDAFALLAEEAKKCSLP